jgi:hypothetical protein
MDPRAGRAHPATAVAQRSCVGWRRHKEVSQLPRNRADGENPQTWAPRKKRPPATRARNDERAHTPPPAARPDRPGATTKRATPVKALLKHHPCPDDPRQAAAAVPGPVAKPPAAAVEGRWARSLPPAAPQQAAPRTRAATPPTRCIVTIRRHTVAMPSHHRSANCSLAISIPCT